MQTTSEPIVNFCEALFNARSLYSSEIVAPKYTKTNIHKPILPSLCWLILDINQLDELAYAGNQIKHVLAMETIQHFDATITQLKTTELFNDCNETQIQNTIINLCNRLGITEQLKQYARCVLATGGSELLPSTSLESTATQFV